MSLSPTDARAIYTNFGFPITRAFGHSLTEGVPSQLPGLEGVQELNDAKTSITRAPNARLSSRTEPVVPQGHTSGSLEARDFAEADISNQPPPYSSGNTVDRIIQQYGSSTQDSSATQSQAGTFEYSDESDDLLGQYDRGADSNDGISHVAKNEPCPPPPFNTPVATGQGAQGTQDLPKSATESSPEWEANHLKMAVYAYKGTSSNQNLPEKPHTRNFPLHPSNPFATPMKPASRVNPSPRSNSPDSPRPLLHYSDSEDDYARTGSDLGIESEAEAENRLSRLQPPPERMHSAARRKERGRRSVANDAHTSTSGIMTGDSDNDDPFKYDGLFPQPSKEREVSLCLHQVSGIGGDGTAFDVSPQKTPLRSTGQYFTGEAASPTEQRLLNNNTWSSDMTSSRVFGRNSKEQHRDSIHHGQSFFDFSAVNPEWALGSPDAVRVPVRQRNFSNQERSSAGAQPGAQEVAQQLALEGLHCDEGQNRRATGYTED